MISKCKWVAEQTCQAAKTGKVTIRSGHTIPVWMAFRCLYCGEYFSQAAAEEHFGETRAEYKSSDECGLIKECENIAVYDLGKSEIR